MFQRILVPLDGSDGAECAIPVAARIARACGGAIVFVQVVPPPTNLGTYATPANGLLASKPNTFEKDLADAASYLTATTAAYADDLAGIKTEIDVASGAAASTISSAARLEDVDLIVMATQGRGGLRHLVMGSVTEHVLNSTKLPLLIVRPHEAEAKREKPGETTKAEVTEVEVQMEIGLM